MIGPSRRGGSEIRPYRGVSGVAGVIPLPEQEWGTGGLALESG
jgi:hypothetical protein